MRAHASVGGDCHATGRRIALGALVITALLALLRTPARAEGASEPPRAGWRVLPQGPGQEARCIVCGGPMAGGGDLMVSYRGRAVAVCGHCTQRWAADPDVHIAAVQARSALFDEESLEAGRTGNAWLWVGLYVLAGTLVGGFCAHLAISRGLSPLRWFLGGLLLNVLALGLLAGRRGDTSGLPEGVPPGLRKVPGTYAPGRCPACGAEHHPSAAVCGACAAPLRPRVRSEVERAGSGREA